MSMENQTSVEELSTETPVVETGEVEVVDNIGNFKEEVEPIKEEVEPVKEKPVKEKKVDRSAYNCPICAGEGLVKVNNIDDRCSNCGGTGKV